MSLTATFSKLIPFIGKADGLNGMISLVTTLICFHSIIGMDKYNGNPIEMNAVLLITPWAFFLISDSLEF